MSVVFSGEDGRVHTYRTDSIPLRALHDGLCRAFEKSTGFDGTLRTERSATGAWQIARRFLKVLDASGATPRSWREVSARSFAHFEEVRADALADEYGEMRRLYRLLTALPSDDALNEDAVALLSRRRRHRSTTGVGGYDDQAFNALVAAALRDVKAMSERLARGEELLGAFRAEDSQLSAEESALGEALDRIDRRGIVRAPVGLPDGLSERLTTARYLHLSYDDLAPLLVLLVAVTGCNVETIKELGATHSVKDDKAVLVDLTKRRRGPGKWHEQDLWEIGKAGRELTRPGSLFRAVHEMTRRARERCGSDRLLTVWTNPHREGERTRAGRGFHFAWESGLAMAPLHLSRWARSHGLTEAGEPLRVSLNRVRTSVLVRRARSLGGHLPSAARSNSQDVLFKSYLKPDATIASWADDVINESFRDAEALVLHSAKAPVQLRSDDSDGVAGPIYSAEPGTEQTGYLGCSDILHSPFDEGRMCKQTALICFQCPNAVFADHNLPAMIALRDELIKRYDAVNTSVWNARYSAAWTAITEHILPRFTPEQLDAAQMPSTAVPPLRLLEERWTD